MKDKSNHITYITKKKFKDGSEDIIVKNSVRSSALGKYHPRRKKDTSGDAPEMQPAFMEAHLCDLWAEIDRYIYMTDEDEEPMPEKPDHIDQRDWQYEVDGAGTSKSKFHDIMRENQDDWHYWITLTFNTSGTEDERRKAAKRWRGALRKRAPEAKSLCVPEQQTTRGGLHFHVVAGCLTPEQLKLKENGFDKHGRRVWTVANWKHGISHVVEIEKGTWARLSNYMKKQFGPYIDKETGEVIMNRTTSKDKRRYWPSRNLERPTISKGRVPSITPDPYKNARLAQEAGLELIPGEETDLSNKKIVHRAEEKQYVVLRSQPKRKRKK